MTMEDKMMHLKDAAMEEARAQGNAIISDHKKALERIHNTHIAEAKQQAETRVQAAKGSAKHELNATASKEQLKLRREYGNVQTELKNQLFKEVKELLEDYKKTDAYKQYLVSYIHKAAEYADGQSLTIYIDKSDEGLKGYLEEYTGMTITISQEDFIGGVRSVIPGRNVLVDRTFKGSLEREYRDFVFTGGGSVE